MNEEYAGTPGSASGAALATDGLELSGMAWDLDVDAFLDDYLKDVDTSAPDFGNYGVQIPSSVKSEPGPSSSEGLSERLAKQASLGGGTSMAQDFRESPSPPPRGKSSAARKQTALQEKNRRAQRRFRERQKMKVAELEAQVSSLTAQLERLTADHTALAAHSQRVESALAASAAREERAAAAAAACSPRSGNELGRAPSGPPAAPALSTTGGVPSAPVEATGSGIDVGAMAVGLTELRGSDPSTAGGGRSGGGLEDEGRLPVVFQGNLRLTLRDGQSLSLTASQLRDMTPAELARYYKTYVNELAQSLVEGGAPGSRVEALVDDVCRLWTRVGLCNPAGVKHFSLTRVEPGAAAAGGPDDRVAAVSRALDLRPDQRASLARLRALFGGKLAGIRARRRAVVETLARAEPSGTGTRALAALYLASHEAARSLREALREEHILVLDFESTIFKHVLTSLQVAQLMIHSFPWTPDCLSLCTWIAAEAGDADALSSLALEAQRKAAAAAAAAASGVHGLPHVGTHATAGPQCAPGTGGGPPNPDVGLGLPRQLSVYIPSPFAVGVSPPAGSDAPMSAGGNVPNGCGSAAALGVTPRATSAPSMPVLHSMGSCGAGQTPQSARAGQSFGVNLASFGGVVEGVSGMMPVHTAT